MLPGLPPRDKSFKDWLFSLVIPIAAFVILIGLVSVIACMFGNSAISVDGVRYTGFAAVLRIVLAGPVFFVLFLLLTTTICWLDSRWRRFRQK